MKNKKAVEIHFLIMLVIGVFVFIVLVIMVPNLLGKGGKETQGYLDDFDSDGVVNSLDKCTCEPGEKDNDGCKSGYTDQQKEESDCNYCRDELLPKRCPA